MRPPVFFARWAMASAAVLTVACKDTVRPDATGSIALQIVVGGDEAAAGSQSPAMTETHLDSAIVTATSSATTKTLKLTKQATTFTGTITDVPVGSYTVIVRGFAAGAVDYYGVTTNVTVSANTTATASVTFSVFVPALSAISPSTTWSFRPSVTFTSVPNAASYDVEVDRSNTFPNPVVTGLSGTSGSFVVSDTGTYYVRVRAKNSVVTGGRPSNTVTVRVTTDLRASGNTAATSTNLGFGASAAVTLDSLNIFPAADDDWFALGECNGDSLTVTAQAVRLSPGSPLNSGLQLFNTTGRVIVQNDDADSTDARLGTRLVADGAYLVRVRGSGTTVGHYKLVVQVSTGPNNAVSSCKVVPLAVTQVSGGLNHTCAVRSNGTVDCWGYNRDGQLGMGSTISASSSPQKVSGSVVYQTVTAGAFHSCGRTSGGVAYCWGWNGVGALGNGSNTNSNTPVLVSGSLNFASLSAGTDYTCGVTSTGAGYCWGYNFSGQLGNGTTTNSNVPVLISGYTFAAIVAGDRHTCGLTTGGAAYCWGANPDGELGNGTTSNSSSPVAVIGGNVFASITSGADHTCGRTGPGAAYCWGYGGYGAIGNGSTSNSLSPALVSGGLVFTQLSAGGYTTCGMAGGNTYCWGNNFDGQVGDASTISRTVPTLVSTATTFQAVAAGWYHTCGLQTTTGNVYCWGWNGLGQLGDGSSFDHAAPVAISGGLSLTRVSTGNEHTCAVATNTGVYCWGYNNNGQLGDGSFTDRTTPGVVSNPGVSAVGAGSSHSCYLTTGSSVYCWGNNNSGQLGNGTTANSSTPVLTSAFPTPSSLTVGDNHNCGLSTPGAAFCWGDNADGQLGNGTLVNSLTPAAVSGGLVFKQVSAGGIETCGATTAGLAYCWGDNSSGGLGNGTVISSTTPVRVTGTQTWATVSAGYDFACGVTTTGTGYCWGDNSRGQLGNGTTNDSNTPVLVSGGLSWKVISASRNNSTCGTTTSDVLYCWGGNFTGRLGNGTFTDASTPTAVLAAVGFQWVQAGDVHTCGVSLGGTGYCWGNNERGELGNGTTTIKTTPIAVVTGPASVPPMAAAAGWMLTSPTPPSVGPRDARAGSRGSVVKGHRPRSPRLR